MNHHNIRVWVTKNAHEFVEHVRDFPKVNVLRAVSASKVYWPFYFDEQTITGVVYLDMLPLWQMSQLQEDKADFILHQDEAPAYFLGDV